MTVLAVLGGLLALLVVACVLESRSGRRAWGVHLDGRERPDAGAAGTAGTAAALGTLAALDGGDG